MRILQNLACIQTNLWAKIPRNRGSIPCRAKRLFLFHEVQLGSEPTWPTIQGAREAKWEGREADYSSPSGA
jgi:hypothetical protein